MFYLFKPNSFTLLYSNELKTLIIILLNAALSRSVVMLLPLLYHPLCVSFGCAADLCAKLLQHRSGSGSGGGRSTSRTKSRGTESKRQWQPMAMAIWLWLWLYGISNINESQQRQRHRRRAPLLSRGYCRQLRLCFVYERSKTESVVCLSRSFSLRGLGLKWQGHGQGASSVAFGFVRSGKKISSNMHCLGLLTGGHRGDL